MEIQIVSSSPDIMGGTPVFAGTRAPIQTLIDYIEAGESIAGRKPSGHFVDAVPRMGSTRITEMGTNNATRRTRAENASFVITATRALGIEPHPQSRLMKMHRVLTEATEGIQPDDPRFATALEAEHDMLLLGFVFEQPNPHHDRSDFLPSWFPYQFLREFGDSA